MDTIERLVAANLLDAFDDAAKQRNKDEMIRILTQVDYSDEGGELHRQYDHPEVYG